MRSRCPHGEERPKARVSNHEAAETKPITVWPQKPPQMRYASRACRSSAKRERRRRDPQRQGLIVSLLVSTWRRRSRPAYALTVGLLLSLSALPSLAQDDLPPAEEAPEPQPAQIVKPQGGDSMGARLGRLEEKIRDLQVMVGTLESFVRAKPGAVLPQEVPPPVAQGQSAQGDLGPRIDE